MSRQEWKTVGLFLLKHFTRLVNGDGAPAGTDYENVQAVLGEDGSEDFEGRETLCSYVDSVMADRDRYLTAEDDAQDRETALEQDISILKDQVKRLSAKGELELELTKVQKTLEDTVMMWNKQLEESHRLGDELKALKIQQEVDSKKAVDEAEEAAEVKWKAWAEKEAQVKAGKAVSAERKKWQAKGKALPVEKVTIATQTDHIQKPTVAQFDEGTQTEVVLEELEKAMKRKRERKGKGRAKDSEDTVMKDGSNNSDTDQQMYEDLSRYEDENEALVAAPLATKKQAAPRSAARPAGKRSRPAKTPPRSASPDDNGPLVKAMVIHGVPCQRPMADTIQDIGVKGIIGARWLLGGMWRLGKTTSSVVVFFDRRLALGSHLKVRGRWLPIEAYD